MHPRVLMVVTTSLRSWNDYNAFERMLCHFHQKGVSIMFTIGFIVFFFFFLTFYVLFWTFCVFLLWAFIASSNKWWTAFLHPPPPYRVLTTTSHTTCGILSWNCFSSSRLAAFSHPFKFEIDLPKIALSCHFALDLLCYKESAYDPAWRFTGHYCPWTSFILCGKIVTLVAPCSSLWLTPSLHNFAPVLVLRAPVST